MKQISRRTGTNGAMAWMSENGKGEKVLADIREKYRDTAVLFGVSCPLADGQTLENQVVVVFELDFSELTVEDLQVLGANPKKGKGVYSLRGGNFVYQYLTELEEAGKVKRVTDFLLKRAVEKYGEMSNYGHLVEKFLVSKTWEGMPTIANNDTTIDGYQRSGKGAGRKCQIKASVLSWRGSSRGISYGSTHALI